MTVPIRPRAKHLRWIRIGFAKSVMTRYAPGMRHIHTALKSTILATLLQTPMMTPRLRQMVAHTMGQSIPVQTFYDAITALEASGLIIRGKLKERTGLEAIDDVLKRLKRLKRPMGKADLQESIAARAGVTCSLTDVGRHQALIDKVEPFVQREGRPYVAQLRKLVAIGAKRNRAGKVEHARV